MWNRVCCVHPAFQENLKDAIVNIQNAKLKLVLYDFDHSHSSTVADTPEQVEPGLGDKLTVLVNDINIAMNSLPVSSSHAILLATGYKYPKTWPWKIDSTTQKTTKKKKKNSLYTSRWETKKSDQFLFESAVGTVHIDFDYHL